MNCATGDGGESLSVHQLLRNLAPDYRKRFDSSMPGRHRQVLKKILSCRSPALGGQLFACAECRAFHYRYHSCNDRHCPQCGQADADLWFKRQQARLLLPTPYFLVTFTVPEALRMFIRSHQQIALDLLFACSAQALQDLAANPRLLGAQLGLLGVLHTWSRTLIFHPHIHYLIPAGGLRSTRAALPLPLRLQDRHLQSQSPAPGRWPGALELSRQQTRSRHLDQTAAPGVHGALSPTHPATRLRPGAYLWLVALGRQSPRQPRARLASPTTLAQSGRRQSVEPAARSGAGATHRPNPRCMLRAPLSALPAAHAPGRIVAWRPGRPLSQTPPMNPDQPPISHPFKGQPYPQPVVSVWRCKCSSLGKRKVGRKAPLWTSSLSLELWFGVPADPPSSRHPRKPPGTKNFPQRVSVPTPR